jgi:hypothetical protein
MAILVVVCFLLTTTFSTSDVVVSPPPPHVSVPFSQTLITRGIVAPIERPVAGRKPPSAVDRAPALYPCLAHLKNPTHLTLYAKELKVGADTLSRAVDVLLDEVNEFTYLPANALLGQRVRLTSTAARNLLSCFPDEHTAASTDGLTALEQQYSLHRHFRQGRLLHLGWALNVGSPAEIDGDTPRPPPPIDPSKMAELLTALQARSSDLLARLKEISQPAPSNQLRYLTHVTALRGAIESTMKAEAEAGRFDEARRFQALIQNLSTIGMDETPGMRTRTRRERERERERDR